MSSAVSLPSSTARQHLGRSKSAMRPRNRAAKYSAPNVTTAVKPIKPPQNKEITLVVLGGSRVGKSALVSQFLWEEFPSDYRPTVEEFNWIEYDAGKTNAVLLQVIDSGGSRDFLAMRHLYIRTSDAFLVVFSVDDPDSFEEAKKIVDEIKEQRGAVPIALVANKRDLYNDIQDWPVKYAYQFAYSRTIPIIECNSKVLAEVTYAFRDVLERLCDLSGDLGEIGIKELRKRRQSMPSSRAYSGIDLTDIEKLKYKNKSNCVIS